MTPDDWQGHPGDFVRYCKDRARRRIHRRLSARSEIGHVVPAARTLVSISEEILAATERPEYEQLRTMKQNVRRLIDDAAILAASLADPETPVADRPILFRDLETLVTVLLIFEQGSLEIFHKES